MVRRRSAVAVIVAVLGSASCTRAATVATTTPSPAGEPATSTTRRSHVVADPELASLPVGAPPPAPTLPPPVGYIDDEVPMRHDNGAWSIRGLREHLDANLGHGESGHDIEILAWVQEIYVAPSCPATRRCPPPERPHLWVTDVQGDEGKRNALLVMNYAFAIPEWDEARWKGQPSVVMERGKRYRIRGRFRRASDTGVVHDRGYFEFVAVESTDHRGKTSWVIPPGAPWHPLELARQRREEQ
jgi:hypothetical protein